MYFKRKAYDRLLEWKAKYSDKYAALLEGAKRVGKSTIAESFGQNEYKSYLLIDFSKTTDNIRSCFEDVGNLNMFFLRLQAETGVTLYEHESLIIFDEVQLFSQARQAIRHLVADGRYSYLETGSLISIKKNVKDILIPSEEMKIQVYPMDYEEFCDATGGNYELLRQIYGTGSAIGQATNRKLMRDLRIYMAVGGMPQAVEAYTEGKNSRKLIWSRDRSYHCMKMILRKLMRLEEFLHCIIRFRRSSPKIQKNIGFQQQSGRRVKQKQRNYYMS